MSSQKELAELVGKVLAGDAKAFEKLYLATNRRVYFLCLHFMKEEQEAEDMVQETYLTAYKKLKDLRDAERFTGWLEQIAANLCRNRLMKKMPVPLDDETMEGMLTEESENFLPEEYITNCEKRRIVMDIMRESLSDIQYQTVLLYYFNNLTVDEVANVMECPPGTVMYRLSVSRAKIKKGVEAYEHRTHDKLYSFAGVPFLALLLSEEAKACEVPELTEQVMGAVRELGAAAQTTRAGAAANRAGAQLTDVAEGAGNAVAEAVKETAGNAAKGVANGAAKAVTTGTADNVIGTAGKEIGKMAAKGFLSSTAAKIAIGAAVVVVGAGAVVAVVHNNQQDKEETVISVDAGNSQGGQASGGESAAAGQSAESAQAESAAGGVNPMTDGVSGAGADTAQQTIEAGGAESKYDESMKGRVEGTSYINDYFGFWADLDENWELKDYDAIVAGTSLAKETFTELLAGYNHLTIFSGTNHSGGDDMGFFWVQIADEANYDTEFAQEIVPENVKEARFRRQVTHVASTSWFGTREDVMYLGTVECGDLKGYYYIHEEVEYDGSPNITEDIFLFDNNICVRINIGPWSYGVENIEQLRERLAAIEEHMPLKNRVETEVITERIEEQ